MSFFQLEHELSMTDKRTCMYSLHRYVLSWSSDYPACHPNPTDLVGSELCHKGTLTDEAEHGANDTTLRSCLMNALMPETGMFNGFAIEVGLVARARRHPNSSNGFS